MSISLCCIVKNEQACIADMLESVSELVDEMIVVDTGSTDATLEIAATFAAKIYKFSWVDDFAAARNHSLSLATNPWILVLDADERLNPGDLQTLKDISARNAEQAYFLKRRHYQTSANFPFFKNLDQADSLFALGAKGYFSTSDLRFFKKHPNIKFQGAVHESVEDSVRSCPDYEVIYSEIVLHHIGALLEPKRQEAKVSFYLSLAKKKVSEDPADWRNWYQVGVEHQNANQFADAEICFKKTIQLMPDRAEAWRQLGISLVAQDRFTEALDVLRKSVEIDNNNSLAWNALGVCMKELDFGEQARLCFERALQIEPNNQVFAGNLKSLESI